MKGWHLWALLQVVTEILINTLQPDLSFLKVLLHPVYMDLELRT